MRKRYLRAALGLLLVLGCALQTCRADGVKDDANPLPDLAIARLGSLPRKLDAPGMPIVSALAFTPDGKRLVSYRDGDRDLCVWHLGTGKIERRLSGAAPVAFSANGCRLATVDAGNYFNAGECHIRLWNFSNGKLIRRFPAHVCGIWRLEFAPNGKTLLSAGADQRIRLWAVDTGARLVQLRSEGVGICAQFATDGSAILAGDDSARSLSGNQTCGRRSAIYRRCAMTLRICNLLRLSRAVRKC